MLKLGITTEIASRYMRFGVFLLNDKTGSIMTSIEISSQGRPEDIVFAVLEKWLVGSGRAPTWYTLIETLRYCQLNVLANRIQLHAEKLHAGNLTVAFFPHKMEMHMYNYACAISPNFNHSCMLLEVVIIIRPQGII